MAESLTVKVSAHIAAPPAVVWKALVTPALIKKYFFGTDASSDWQEGSEIVYQGEYQGKTYRDKGIIRKIVPDELLQHTYWSSMSGKEDKPENYLLVTYTLEESGDHTHLTVTQENVGSEAQHEHSTENWKSVLAGLKQVVELQ